MDDATIWDWKGRSFVAEDELTERLVAGFRATLEPHLAPFAEGEAPLASHWCLFHTDAPMAELGGDGHPKRYPYLPPPPLPRRMWAGGNVEFLAPLRVGDRVTRTTTLTDIQRKEGRSGELWFLAVDHEYATSRGTAIRERHDIVYRAAAGEARPAAPAPVEEGESPPSPGAVWRVKTPPTLLFRYSALTFNTHRIHYDYPYAREVEGYEGLVVHGPLQATLLVNAAATVLGATPRAFSYRGKAPATGGRDLDVCVDATTGDVHTQSAAGVHMEGRAER